MSDECREAAWADHCRRGFGGDPVQMAQFMHGFDAANVKVAQLEAALRVAREALALGSPPRWQRALDAALAEINAALGDAK